MIAINSDPEVTRYLNRPVDRAATLEFSDRVLAHWERWGYGLWAVIDRAAERFIGFAGLLHPDFLPALSDRTEIGWRLDSRSWGHGYATEASSAVRDHAFGPLGLEELIAIIHPDNARSQRVAAKLGMAVERQVDNPVLGRPVDVWSIAAPGRRDHL